MAQQGIHYFPGHMKKALALIAPLVKSVDMVVEIVDARAPFSTRNTLLNQLIGQKPRVIVMSKNDMADPEVTKAWISFFKEKGIDSIAGDLKKDKIVNLLKNVGSSIIASKREKERKVGMKPQPLRIMVIGVPNVGKSTLINNIAGKKRAVVGNKAGVTRGEQWIRLSDDFMLLDTPGVLPMNYEDAQQALRLALLGNMKEEVLPTEELAQKLLDILRETYPNALSERFGITDLRSITNDDTVLSIASKRGLLEGSEPSLTKGSYLLIKEFKDGIVGRISLEAPNA